ncbi:MAG: hypothetical protein MJZ56_07670, partial [Bacteroidales bacterium]|nr:hypothetical protein [Bacteroidales bacterium]
MVKQSFAWLENFRRPTIDYEYLADTAEAMVQLAFAQIMLNKFFPMISEAVLISYNDNYIVCHFDA